MFVWDIGYKSWTPAFPSRIRKFSCFSQNYVVFAASSKLHLLYGLPQTFTRDFNVRVPQYVLHKMQRDNHYLRMHKSHWYHVVTLVQAFCLFLQPVQIGGVTLTTGVPCNNVVMHRLIVKWIQAAKKHNTIKSSKSNNTTQNHNDKMTRAMRRCNQKVI